MSEREQASDQNPSRVSASNSALVPAVAYLDDVLKSVKWNRPFPPQVAFVMVFFTATEIKLRLLPLHIPPTLDRVKLVLEFDSLQ